MQKDKAVEANTVQEKRAARRGQEAAGGRQVTAMTDRQRRVTRRCWNDERVRDSSRC